MKEINLNKFHVVTVISNVNRYSTRYELYKQFEDYVLSQGINLTTVEIAFGKRDFEVIKENPRVNYVKLRTDHEIWHKENMINLGIERLPRDWEYVAWVDADVSFARTDWALETVQQLQHFDILQMFSVAYDLTPLLEPFQVHRGFCWVYYHDKVVNNEDCEYKFGHTGYAWAARRETIDRLGGLIDFAILGASDHHMAKALIGRAKDSFHADCHNNYAENIFIWQDRAEQYIKHNIGYVDGALLHYWHGKKRDRRYKERWEILIRNKFDPKLDLKRDWQGLWQLTDRNPKLRYEIREYFRQRSEDSIDFDERERKIQL